MKVINMFLILAPTLYRAFRAHLIQLSFTRLVLYHLKGHCTKGTAERPPLTKKSPAASRSEKPICTPVPQEPAIDLPRRSRSVQYFFASPPSGRKSGNPEPSEVVIVCWRRLLAAGPVEVAERQICDLSVVEVVTLLSAVEGPVQAQQVQTTSRCWHRYLACVYRWAVFGLQVVVLGYRQGSAYPPPLDPAQPRSKVAMQFRGLALLHSAAPNE